MTYLTYHRFISVYIYIYIYICIYIYPATDEILPYVAWLRWPISVDVAMVILNGANDLAVLCGVAVSTSLCCYHVSINLVLVFPGRGLATPVKSFPLPAGAEV